MSSPAANVDVLSLVAPNGLGHFRRQVEILSRVLAQVPGSRIHVLCAGFQRSLTRDWELSERFFSDPRVTWSENILDPGVTWSTSAGRYDDGVLSAWMDRLAQLPQLKEAQLVVSDNLAGVLAFRSDAILAGSFLWGDVLAKTHHDSVPVQAFARLEQELLARYRPPMICVGDIAMPAVLSQTNHMSVDWMCEHPIATSRLAPPAVRIGLLGGASGAADALLAGIAQALSANGAYQLALPASLLDAAPDAVLFRHRREDYAALSVAICRPGIGTVTACIAEGVPMVTVHEGVINPELSHVGSRLEAMGVAVNLGSDPLDHAVIAAVERVLNPGPKQLMREKILALPRNGLEQAADFLAARLSARA